MASYYAVHNPLALDMLQENKTRKEGRENNSLDMCLACCGWCVAAKKIVAQGVGS